MLSRGYINSFPHVSLFSRSLSIYFAHHCQINVAKMLLSILQCILVKTCQDFEMIIKWNRKTSTTTSNSNLTSRHHSPASAHSTICCRWDFFLLFPTLLLSSVLPPLRPPQGTWALLCKVLLSSWPKWGFLDPRFLLWKHLCILRTLAPRSSRLCWFLSIS